MISNQGSDRAEGEYRMSGDHRLYPSQMGDDGVHTYIIWPEEAALAAMYTMEAQFSEPPVAAMEPSSNASRPAVPIVKPPVDYGPYAGAAMPVQ